jgi:hypothetical protein
MNGLIYFEEWKNPLNDYKIFSVVLCQLNRLKIFEFQLNYDIFLTYNHLIELEIQ